VKKLRDPRREREELERYGALTQALARLADDRELRRELDAARPAKGPNADDDVVVWLATDPDGQTALGAAEEILRRHGLPTELTAWAATLAVTGSASPVLASEYVRTRLAPCAVHETDPLTHQGQILIRVPADWSGRRIAAWVAMVHARLQVASFQDVPLAKPKERGRPTKTTQAKAIELATAFEAERMEQVRSGSLHEAPQLGVEDWIDAFQRWLDARGEARSAEHLYKQHLRAAVRRGALAIGSLAVSARRSPRGRTPRTKRSQVQAGES
jgi:hypothetical protein